MKMKRIDIGKSIVKITMEYDDGSKEELDKCVVLEDMENGFILTPFNITGPELAEFMFKVVVSHLPGGDE